MYYYFICQKYLEIQGQNSEKLPRIYGIHNISIKIFIF